MHYESLYNRIKFYLVSAITEKAFSHIFRKKSTCHYLDFVIYGGNGPVKSQRPLQRDSCKTVLSPAVYL